MRRGPSVLALALWTLFTFVLWATFADASVFRYKFVPDNGGRFPSTRVPGFMVADLESELPTSDVAPGDLAFAKDSGKLFKRTSSAWVEVGAGGEGGPATWGDIEGTLGDQTDLQSALDGKEASGAFSGVGSCGANAWANVLNDGTAPGCAQPSFANLAGAAVAAQLPNPGAGSKGGVSSLTCGGTDKLSAIGTDGVPVCSADEEGSGGGAPTDATYITQTAHAGLSAEQALGALATGILKNTTTSGVLSIAVAGDFPTLNQNTTGTAAALTSNPSDCATSTHFAVGVDASGVAVCEAIADADVPNNITVDTAATANAGDSATSFFSAGTIETARLGSGTADATTFLRGDQTWATPAGGGGGGPTVVRVTADVADTSITTWQDVTGLTKAVTSGVTYSFACFLTYTTAATTTALHLSVNGPTVTALDYGVEMSTTATARHNSAQTAYDTVVNPATGGGATRLPATIHGSIIPSANGTLAVRMRTEINASAATVKRGSWCEFHQL